MNEKKNFTYGGYTFVPLGQFTDAGYKKDAPIGKIMNDLYFINRGCVADGHEKYNYDDFYKAAKVAGCGDADIFLCKETKEMYVPCQYALPIFDKTVKDADEVQQRFDHRKEPCPINNGADLNSDAMLEALFDDGQYLEQQNGRLYKALGFICEHPMLVRYSLGQSVIDIERFDQSHIWNHEQVEKEIDSRLRCEDIEVELHYHGDSWCQSWRVHFYYTPAYVVENFYPKE